MDFEKLASRFRIDKPDKFKLSEHDPADTAGLSIDKNEAKDMLADGIKRLSDLQGKLYAHDRWSMLAMFQAMDAAGKDGVIKHVMTGINPQGCQVHAFKAPSAEELDHDFLWRAGKALPERGRIGIFNRSHYEEVLVVRVHPEFLDKQRLPKSLIGKDIWEERYKSIRTFERHIARSGTCMLKFFLNVSRDEQRKRFLERLEQPAKRWKFSADDITERARWDDYMAAYQDMIRATSTPEAPWYVVPADNKWFTRLVVAAAMVDTMEKLDLAFPKVDPASEKQFEEIRKALIAEKNGRNGKNGKA